MVAQATDVPALAPANGRNKIATRAGRQTDCQVAQQPVRTACCARQRGERVRQNAVRSAQADEKDGGASHRVGRPPRLRSPRALATPEQGSFRCIRYPPGCAAMAHAPRRQRAARHRRQHRACCSNTSEPDPAVQPSGVRNQYRSLKNGHCRQRDSLQPTHSQLLHDRISQKSIQITQMAGKCRQRDSNPRRRARDHAC